MGIAFYNSVIGQFPYDFPSREECARMIRRGERPRDPISFILGDDKPIPVEKRLPGIDILRTASKCDFCRGEARVHLLRPPLISVPARAKHGEAVLSPLQKT